MWDAVDAVDAVDGGRARPRAFHEECTAICCKAAAASRWEGKQPCDALSSPTASKPFTPRCKMAPTYLLVFPGSSRDPQVRVLDRPAELRLPALA
jgi:hypothetical protein